MVAKHNENDAFVTIVCSWTHSTIVVHWLQTIIWSGLGWPLGNMVRSTAETKSWLRNFFSHQLTLQMFPSFYKRQSIRAMRMSSRLICYELIYR